MNTHNLHAQDTFFSRTRHDDHFLTRTGRLFKEPIRTAREAMVAGGVDRLHIETAPMGYQSVRNPEVGPEWIPTGDNKRVIIDAVSHTVLGTATTGYTPYQPTELFDFVDSLKGDFEFTYTCAGMVHGGRKVWLGIELPEKYTIRTARGAEREHRQFLFAIGGNDGVTPIVFLPQDGDMWCTNMIPSMIQDRDAFRVKHTRSLYDRLEVARAAMLAIPEAARETHETFQEFADTPMDDTQFVHFAMALLLDAEGADRKELIDHTRELYADKVEKGGRGKTILDNKVAELLEAYKTGIGNEGVSRYDAISAVTQIEDHKDFSKWLQGQRDRVAATKRRYSQTFDSSLMGAGSERKRRAVALLKRW